MTILIAITGGSGSGKSTLAEALVSSLPAGVAVLMREDSYYLDAASVPGFDAETHDFDDVAARDHDLLVEHLKELKAGRPVVAPLYSFLHRPMHPGADGPVRHQGLRRHPGRHSLHPPPAARPDRARPHR